MPTTGCGGCTLILVIALYAFITESWWIFFLGEALFLLIGAVEWLRSQGDQRFAKPSERQ